MEAGIAGFSVNESGEKFDLIAKSLFIIGMTSLARGIFTVAFLALMLIQPAGQWFCTDTNTACPIGSSMCCSVVQDSCCDTLPEQNNEGPCCIEFAGEWQLVPATALVTAPEPLIADLNLPGVILSLETLALNESSSWKVTGLDPPPIHSVDLARFCVRLI